MIKWKSPRVTTSHTPAIPLLVLISLPKSFPPSNASQMFAKVSSLISHLGAESITVQISLLVMGWGFSVVQYSHMPSGDLGDKLHASLVCMRKLRCQMCSEKGVLGSVRCKEVITVQCSFQTEYRTLTLSISPTDGALMSAGLPPLSLMDSIQAPEHTLWLLDVYFHPHVLLHKVLFTFPAHQ